MKTFKILSLDGGGIRGLVSAKIIAELEKRMGLPCNKVFDLIAGTSAGGINAVALGCGYGGSGLIELYKENAHRIFKKQSFWKRFFGLREEKYDSNSLYNVLKETLGDKLLKDSPCGIMTTTFDTERYHPHFFKSWKDTDFSMVDAAFCTALAPTYFEPQRIDKTNTHYTLIDGGVAGLNNPVMCAVIEGLKRGYKPEHIVVVSIGNP